MRKEGVMMQLSEMELKKLIQSGETNTVELKVAAPRAVEMAERLCGLANAQGGMIILGVKDAKHEIVGIPDHRIGETLDVISRAVRQMIKPELALDPPEPEIYTVSEKKTRDRDCQAQSWARLSGSRNLLGETWYPYRFLRFVGIARNGE
jgi:hypothetical protein